MTHAKTFVLVPPDTLPENAAAAAYDLLGRYARNELVAPYRDYLGDGWMSVVAKRHGVTDPHELAAKVAATSQAVTGVDEKGRIYVLETENPFGRYDYAFAGLNFCGRWDNGEPDCRFGRCTSNEMIRAECNLRRVADLPVSWTCALIVTPDGEWHELKGDVWHSFYTWDAEQRVRRRRPWPEHEAIERERTSRDWVAEWEAVRAAILARYAEHWVMLFDVHL